MRSNACVICKTLVRNRRFVLKFAVALFVLVGLFAFFAFSIGFLGNCRGQEEELEPSNALATSPFVPGQPKLVVLVSYQRSGSSFVGEWFNTNPEVFFNFEPIDSLYSAMYGTRQNQNVPSDISNYRNGTIRQIPDVEIEAVADLLRQYLTCDTDSMPTQTLLNFYTIASYFHHSAADYTHCIRPTFGAMYQYCEQFVARFCGSRFGEKDEERQRFCLRRLWSKPNQVDRIRFVERDADFDRHQKCVAAMRKKLNARCLPLLAKSCKNRSIRVVKTVRATMESMRPLLETIPNFRVIHLVRDPRAVALSRRKFPGNVLGLYAGNNSDTISKEARLYCNAVVRDIKIRKELERKYPGKIYPLLFEELASNTTLFLSNVYKFLGAKPSNLTERWLTAEERKNRAKNISSVQIINRWQNEVSFRINKEIVENCKEFYRITKHTWTL